ncbi:hypothetical protein IWX81_000393 [Salinibacterium sp. CAN_S4]|uniref:DUF4287 domain-containing protein n=1 Tax=Salinibacterium sp. CAN_S4 TaxID=2787727 RepID=UPI0018EF6FEE
MSFQAYLDTIEKKTGLTPREILAIAAERGLDTPPLKPAAIVDWLKDDYGLGRGHAMALVHVIKNGPTISEKHVGTDGVHSDASTELWLDGAASNPAAGQA